MKKCKIKKYGSGGFLKNLWNNVKDFGLYQLDNVTSVINPDIINSSNYNTKFFKGASEFTGNIVNKAAPLAANVLLPGSGTAISALQGVSNNIVPVDEQRLKSDINAVSQGLSSGLSYLPFDKFLNPIPTFKYGGKVEQLVPINTEKGELLISPDGKILKEYNGFPLHPEKGIDPRGNTLEKPGTIVIPRKYAEKFKNSKLNSPERNTIVMNVLKQQHENEIMEENGMYKKGGRIYIKPENRGKFKEYAKRNGMTVQEAANKILSNKSSYSSSLVKRAIFAKNAAKWNKKQSGGQNYIEDDNNIWFPKINTNLDLSRPLFKQDKSWNVDSNTSFDLNWKPFSLIPKDTRLEMDKNGNLYSVNTKTFTSFPKTELPKNLVVKEKTNVTKPRPWYESGTEFLLNSAGPLYNLFTYKKPQPVNYPRISPNYVSPDGALVDANVQSNAAWRNLRNIAGGNAGLYLSNLSAIASDNLRNKYKIRNQYDAMNAEIANKINSMNAEIAIKEKDAYDANIGKYHETKSQAISKLGKNAAEAIKGRNVSEKELIILDYLKNTYPDLFK